MTIDITDTETTAVIDIAVVEEEITVMTGTVMKVVEEIGTAMTVVVDIEMTVEIIVVLLQEEEVEAEIEAEVFLRTHKSCKIKTDHVFFIRSI